MDVPPETAEEDNPQTSVLLEALADWFSRIIRQYPEQWWGLYRGWRATDSEL